MQAKSALFLDRDGVINKDFNYVHLIKDFEFIGGVFEAIRKYQSAGYIPIIITNQSGISRGFYTIEQFNILTNWMLERFLAEGINIAKVYFCPHDPKDECSCRKPLPGMINEAANEFNLDLKSSVLVGDKESDIEAGRNAGIKNLFLVSNTSSSSTGANYVVKSLLDTTTFLKSFK